MAATKYTYSIADDFPATGFNSDRLVADIQESAIATDLSRIASSGDTVDIWFADALSAGDKTILDGDTSDPAGGLIAAHSGTQPREALNVVTDPSMEAVLPGASIVVANGRPAIEVQTGDTGWGAIQVRWPYEQSDEAILKITLKFILKATGTGTVARLAARAKAQCCGDDSSAAWSDTQYEDVTVSHTTLGEVFESTLELDTSDFEINAALALQVGRDGSHANDTVNQAIQIIGVQAEAY